MMITTIGIDLAKTTLHAVAMDASGKVVQRRKLGRAKLVEWLANQGPCLIGMEACAGAHHLARTLRAQGHDVRLMPGQYVKPFVKTHKNDLTDAEAIAEAVQRPQMRFVPIKTTTQLDVQALHRARDRLVGMRTALINQIRGFLLERGLPVARGRRTLEKALSALLEDHAEELGATLRQLIECLRAQWRAVDQPIAALDEQILALARQDDTCQRLMGIPGVGPMLATALVAAIGSSALGFRDGRSLAAPSALQGAAPIPAGPDRCRWHRWLGLVPRQHSTGGKARLLGIARHGNRYLRRLLVHAARSLKRVAIGRDDRLGRWLQGLEARAHANVATVALAAKLARFSWAVMTRNESYHAAA
jgi:transposase